MTSSTAALRPLADSPSIRFAGRSFAIASDLSRSALFELEREIETRRGAIHPFLTAVTDVLVVGHLDGGDPNGDWAREQVRRGEIYRDRWGHLEFVAEDELRSALAKEPTAARSGARNDRLPRPSFAESSPSCQQP
jgi:hypothetical protein